MSTLFDPTKLARPEPISFAGDVWNLLANNDDWIAQYKYDGTRCMVEWRDGGVRLWSRHGRQLANSPELVNRLTSALPDGSVVEGELMNNYTFKAFDMLFYANNSLLGERLRKRLDMLELHLPYTEVLEIEPESYWLAKSKGHEGLVLKNLQDVYPPGGGAKWLKVKS